MTRVLPLLLVTLLLAPELTADRGAIKRTTHKVSNEYVVTLSPDVLPEIGHRAPALAKEYGGKIKHIYRRSIVGFSVTMNEQAALELSYDPAVESVEENGVVQLSATQTDSPSDWHIDRIDQPISTDGSYTYCVTSNPSEPNPVVIYLFDTGVYGAHTEFIDPVWAPHPWGGGARVAAGYNFGPEGSFIGGATDPSICGALSDTRNLFIHGTAVASAAAGRTYGAAKNATIFPVRVFGCNSNPTIATMINAIDYVISESNNARTHVANFSMYYDNAPDSSAFDAAIESLIDNNFVVVTSANNHNQDRCTLQSPARVPRAITVGGTTNSPMDRRVSLGAPCSIVNGRIQNCGTGSNFGACIDIFAPGFAIRTAALSSTSASQTRTDTAATSYSSGIVAGVAARYLEQHPTASPAEVWNWIRDHGVAVVADGRSPSNLLVNVVPECN